MQCSVPVLIYETKGNHTFNQGPNRCMIYTHKKIFGDTKTFTKLRYRDVLTDFSYYRLTVYFFLAFLTISCSWAEVRFDWKTVDEIDDPSMATISNDQVDIVQQLGTVSYAYAVAKHEVSVAQYLEFLNKAAHLGDPNTLYSKTGELNALNGHNVRTGRRITSDPYVYSAKPGRERLPANFLTLEYAARFVNWMANGQRSGGTESGVYNMTEESPSRSAGAQVFLPSPDE